MAVQPPWNPIKGTPEHGAGPVMRYTFLSRRFAVQSRVFAKNAVTALSQVFNV
jgi:hypothetical protein